MNKKEAVHGEKKMKTKKAATASAAARLTLENAVRAWSAEAASAAWEEEEAAAWKAWMAEAEAESAAWEEAKATND